MNIGQLIKDALENLHKQDNELDAKFRNNYSGRSMYGVQCVGIVGSNADCIQVLSNAIKMACLAKIHPGPNRTEYEGHQAFSDLIDTLMNYKQDSMGRGFIMYWPHIPPIDKCIDEDADQY